MRSSVLPKKKKAQEITPEMLEEFRQAVESIERQATLADRKAAIVELHGSVDEWREKYSPPISRDRDMKLGRILMQLMTAAPGRPRGSLRHRADRDRLLADIPLTTYWASVAEAGEAGWEEEADRVRRQRMTGGTGQETGMPSDLWAVKRLLPMWRAWGQVLAESGFAPDFGKLFLVAARGEHPRWQ